jgi:predicted secreted hydrolase
MNPRRRAWLALLAGGPVVPAAAPAFAANTADADAIVAGRPLQFPRDHGAHPGARIEWWYATGWLADAGRSEPRFGWQLTFFRSRTGLAEGLAGRFAPRQLLFAHAAITDLAARQHRHAQRLARWSGQAEQPEAHARREDTAVVLGPWQFRREPGGRYLARLPAPEAGFDLALALGPRQPPLLQGQAGHSRKGPRPEQASHYYSQPQLEVQAVLSLDGRRHELPGTGWLDHEWSDELMPADAVGWDWIGINLADGGALTAFRLRRRDGSTVWAGGSHRPAGGAVQTFGPEGLVFDAQRRWRSPDSGAEYPVAWQIQTPVGRYRLQALLDTQELDSRGSTGAIYWEGLAELQDEAGQRVGLGYLEMTGYAGALKLR